MLDYDLNKDGEWRASTRRTCVVLKHCNFIETKRRLGEFPGARLNSPPYTAPIPQQRRPLYFRSTFLGG